MRLEQSFEVAAPIERVWKTLVDVQHVAPCLPGASVTGRNEDGSFNGTFTVKIGPTTASYTGRLEMESIDEAAHTATMQAQGTDKRGQGGAKATIYSRLAPANGTGTRVDVITDYHITGRLARFGRGGMIEDISARLLREFATRLQSSLLAQADTMVYPPQHAGTAPPAWAGGGAAEATGETAPSSRPSPPPEAAVPPPPPAPPPPPTPPEVPATPAGTASAPTGEAPFPGATPPPPPDRLPVPQPPQPSEPMQALTVLGAALWSQVKRNPAPAVAAGVGVALLLASRRRRRP